MLELKSFHERLLSVVCGLDESVPCSTSHENQQRLSLDILTWTTAIQMNDCGKRYGQPYYSLDAHLYYSFM